MSALWFSRFLAGRPHSQICGDGGAQPCWRHDGEQIFYAAADRDLVAVDLDLNRQWPARRTRVGVIFRQPGTRSSGSTQTLLAVLVTISLRRATSRNG